MSALTGLGALGHLDLDLLGGKQVFPRHAEAAGGHLFDCAVQFRAEAFRQFAALTAVGAAAQPVHSLRHALMGFLGNGAVAHRAGPEAFHDLACRFHFIQRNLPAGVKPEGEHGADRPRSLVLHPRGVFVKGRPVVRPYRLLQQMDGFGSIEVLLGALPSSVLVFTHAGQSCRRVIREGSVVMEAAVRLHPAQVGSAEGAWSIREIGFHKPGVQAHGLKQLGALVGLQYGHAHLGGDLQHAGRQRLIIVADRVLRRLANLSVLTHPADAGVGQVRVHRPGAEGDQHSQLMHIPGLAAFQDDGNRCALLDPDQVLLQGGNRQQRRNRHLFRANAPVGQDQDIDLIAARLVAHAEKVIQRVPQAAFLVIEQGNRTHGKVFVLHLPDPLQFLFSQHRRRKLQHGAVRGFPRKQVAVVAHIDGAVSLDRFPQRVDRRVCHLRETLAEIIVYGRMGLRQGRHRHVRAHGNDGLGTLCRHRKHHVLHVFPCIVERSAELVSLFFIRIFRRRFGPGQILQAHQFLHPFGIGMCLGKAGLQVSAFRKPAALQVRFQYIAGLQLPPAQDMGVLLKQYARFRGQDQPPVVRQRTAQRPQAVPVQGRAYRVAVGIQDRRGTVPGFHHRGIVAVQVFPGRFLFLALPGFGQQDHTCQRQRESVHCQELQRIVQHLAVASVVVDHGQHAPHLRAHNLGTHGLLPGLHAVVVATDRIDLAVVQEHPLRMSLAPGRERVGRETGMHHRHAAGVAHVLQIVIERAQLVHQHHALVDDRSAGQGANIGVRVLVFKNTP